VRQSEWLSGTTSAYGTGDHRFESRQGERFKLTGIHRPNPDGVEVVCASPQLLDGVLAGEAELVQARAEVPEIKV
jgi:hypothetical protein